MGVKERFQKSVEPNQQQINKFVESTRKPGGLKDVIAFLDKFGNQYANARYNGNGGSALGLALHAQQSDIAKELIKRGADYNQRLNGLSDDVPGKSDRGYIPYSNRRLLWHTDGYYNPPERRVRAFVLHCVSPAASGGENALLDPEIAYLLLRDANPEHIRALMQPDAMTIPANTEEGGEGRPAQTGPVFSIDPATDCLHMRYTARTRSIEWKADAATQSAVQALERLLADDSPYVFRYRLAAGEGLLCNNVLHNRTGFADAADKGVSRLIYRARYHDRIVGTGLREEFL